MHAEGLFVEEFVLCTLRWRWRIPLSCCHLEVCKHLSHYILRPAAQLLTRSHVRGRMRRVLGDVTLTLTPSFSSLLLTSGLQSGTHFQRHPGAGGRRVLDDATFSSFLSPPPPPLPPSPASVSPIFLRSHLPPLPFSAPTPSFSSLLFLSGLVFLSSWTSHWRQGPEVLLGRNTGTSTRAPAVWCLRRQKHLRFTQTGIHLFHHVGGCSGAGGRAGCSCD